jgi:uncharacterized lipoprotein YddW (UPF0748 family)
MYSTGSEIKMKKTLIAAAVVILSTLLVCQALSLNQSITIPSSGRILAMHSRAAESQLRGVFYSATSSMSPNNWNTIAATLAPYGINMFDVEVLNDHFAYFPNPYVAYTNSNISGCIAAFHSYGISVYAHIDTMIGALNSDTQCYYLPDSSTFPTTNVSLYNWLDIANPIVMTYMKPLIQYMVGNYSFDGLVLDYSRWGGDMPYGSYDMQQFQHDTGLDVGMPWSTWMSDVLAPSKGGNGKYYEQFMDWRANLVTAWVGNISQWALAINPNLKIGASPHGFGYDAMKPDYARWNSGQDFASWIRLGYINWVAPMLYNSYTVPLNQYYLAFAGAVRAMIGNCTGAAHGQVPIYAFLTLWPGGAAANVTNFVNQVNAINGVGGDGWILWCYAGPGSTNSYGYPDIRQYLNASGLGLPDPSTFALTDVTATALNSTSEQISWTTSSVANSTVEYNSSQLFVWSQLNATDQIASGFPYWQNNHITGFLISNATSVTNHAITLTGLTPGTKYYFRIQSGDPSGIAATAVMTFST